MSRKPESEDAWKAELAFIEAEALKVNRMGMFPSYVSMQADFAASDGFPEIAKSMRKVVHSKA